MGSRLERFIWGGRRAKQRLNDIVYFCALQNCSKMVVGNNFFLRPEEVAQVVENLTTGSKIEGLNHRVKTREQMLAKNVSSFEIIMLSVYGPHSWF